MARNFVAGSSQYLGVATVSYAIPRTYFALSRVDATTQAQGIVALSDASSNFQALYVIEVSGSMYLRVGDVGGAVVTSTTITPLNTWERCIGVFSSASIRLRLNQNSEQSGAAAHGRTYDSMAIGAFPYPTPSGFHDGQVAEVAVWNAALNANQTLELGAGVSPLLVAPESLIHYWRLSGNLSPEIDIIGGEDLTLQNAPTKAAHPAVRYPTSSQIYHVPTAGIAALELNRSPGNLAAWKTGVRIVTP
jgi:hypothetical protein